MKTFIKTIFTKIHKSKMLSLGFIIVTLGGVQTHLPDLITYIPKDWQGAVTAAVGLTIIILRYYTTSSLKDK